MDKEEEKRISRLIAQKAYRSRHDIRTEARIIAEETEKMRRKGDKYDTDQARKAEQNRQYQARLQQQTNAFNAARESQMQMKAKEILEQAPIALIAPEPIDTFFGYKCPNCQEKFKLLRSYDKHMEEQHGIDKQEYQCDYCGFIKRHRDEVTRHEQEKHPQEIRALAAVKQQQLKYENEAAAAAIRTKKYEEEQEAIRVEREIKKAQLAALTRSSAVDTALYAASRKCASCSAPYAIGQKRCEYCKNGLE